MALIASMGWEPERMDVVTAFLYAKLEEETFADISEGFAHVRGEGKVWRLKKCSYGLV